jgi:hypothetical protein
MSFLEKYLAGWQFRSRTPSYAPGDELVVNVTDVDDDTSLVQVGDTRLKLDERVPTGARVSVRVTAFDEETHRGDAELLEVLDTADF